MKTQIILADRGNRPSPGMAFVVVSSIIAATATGQVVNIKLSGPLVPGERVHDFRISPDGNWVVYRVGTKITAIPPNPPNDKSNLFSVPIDGGTPVRLNPPPPPGLPSNGTVLDDYAIDADSLRVVYRSDQDQEDVYELYSVPIDGPSSAGVKLNRPLQPGGSVGSLLYGPNLVFLISPDGQRVVYRANQDSVGVIDLYSVPTGGPVGAGVKISGAMAGSGIGGDSIWVSADSAWVVYRADRDQLGQTELYSVSIDGPSSEIVELNGPLPTTGSVDAGVRISPDSGHVVYPADQDTAGVGELYSVPIRGPAGTGVKLNGPTTFSVGGRDISPESQRVCYVARQGTAQSYELYSVPIVGQPGGGLKISHEQRPNGRVDDQPSFSPDGSRVVYTTTVSLADRHLYSTPSTGPGSAAVRLDGILVPGGQVVLRDIAFALGRVVYMADQDTLDQFELYSVPIEGPSSAGGRISHSLWISDDVVSFRASPDGQRVAYTAGHTNIIVPKHTTDLYAVPPEGPGTAAFRVNGPTVDMGGVGAFEWAPDSNHIVYIANQDDAASIELYVSSLPQTMTTDVRKWGLYR